MDTEFVICHRDKETGKIVGRPVDLEPCIERLMLAAKALHDMETENELRAAVTWLTEYFLRPENILRLKKAAK